MAKILKKDGNPFGAHRVLEPKGVLPQPAIRLDNNMERIWANEILVNVKTLNVDSASFTQLKNEASGDVEKIKQQIMKIVSERGKMQNPVTGSGGILIGVVAQIGDALKGCGLKQGDKISTLVSLSLTPLRLDEITSVKKETDRVDVRGQAVIFESGIYAKLPLDIPEPLAMAALDVCGAPAQTARLVKKGDRFFWSSDVNSSC